MSEIPGIDFSSVTTSADFSDGGSSRKGKSKTKTSERSKSPTDPPPMFQEYWNSARRSMQGGFSSGGEDEESMGNEELARERLKLVQKINMYYDLPRNATRKRLKITARTSMETLKAELYDLENTSIPAAEMFLLATVNLADVVERLSYTKLNFLDLKLNNLGNNVRANSANLMPLMQELSIKYSDLMISNIWVRLGFSLGGIALGTHQQNQAYLPSEEEVEKKAAKVNFKDEYKEL